MYSDFKESSLPIPYAEIPSLVIAYLQEEALSEQMKIYELDQTTNLEIFYILHGSLQFQHEGHAYEARPHDIFVVNGDASVTRILYAQESASFFRLQLTDICSKNLDKNHILIDSHIIRIETGEAYDLAEHIFSSLVEFYKLSGSSDKVSLRFQLLALLTMLHELYDSQYHGQASPAVLSRPKKSAALFQEIKNYIDDHFNESLTLLSISSQFFISQSHLSHLFKKNMGISLMQYVNRKRVQEAADLLLQTDQTITSIAAEVGYESLSHFNVQFKKTTGHSPNSYRKKNKRGGDN